MEKWDGTGEIPVYDFGGVACEEMLREERVSQRNSIFQTSRHWAEHAQGITFGTWKEDWGEGGIGASQVTALP